MVMEVLNFVCMAHEHEQHLDFQVSIKYKPYHKERNFSHT
jgi:hypothetical protein